MLHRCPAGALFARRNIARAGALAAAGSIPVCRIYQLRQKTIASLGLGPRPSQLIAEREGDLPVWVRAPKRRHEFYSGCSRPNFYEWAGKGFIPSVSIRERGGIKGVRLFHLASILGFIELFEIEAKSDVNDSSKQSWISESFIHRYGVCKSSLSKMRTHGS